MIYWKKIVITLKSRLDITNEHSKVLATCYFELRMAFKNAESYILSVATAYVLATNGGYPMPFAIYNDEIVIGFVLIVYDITSYELPKIAEGNYYILRFMIGEQYQKHGYGREAMDSILIYICTFPAGLAEYCWMQYKSDNIVAKKLYESFGFRDNGEIVDNENVTVLKL